MKKLFLLVVVVVIFTSCSKKADNNADVLDAVNRFTEAMESMSIAANQFSGEVSPEHYIFKF